MKHLTSSIYTFENLIRGNFLYIDKTEYLWKLVEPAQAMIFLSRPRRFGKSLTLSTLEAIFQGKRDLFKGLAIYDKPYDWKKYPVIHLDLGNCAITTAAELQDYLYFTLCGVAESVGVHPFMDKTQLGLSFSNLISAMDEGQGVVVLVDEYDKPILNNITNPASKEILFVLKGFYSAIKQSEDRERFAFITGVTKFCHVSLFSDLNNLTDISLNADYATMLGYTQAELESNFAEWIAVTEKKISLPHQEFLAEIKSWYDGYRFEETAESVYNPVSLVNFFTNGGKFRNYWFETGTPSFLMELIKHRRVNLDQVLSEPTSAFTLGSFEIDDIPPVQLLFQTGYLTILSSEMRHGGCRYRLGFPNREVSESFNVYLLDAYSRISKGGVVTFLDHLLDAVEDGDLPKFQKAMEVFFAGIPYDVHHKNEANFQNIFFAIFKLIGISIHAESRTSDGRIDAIIETDTHIYLFEFKLDKDDSALSQIKEKEYFKPYLLSSKKITLVGVNFDTETGRLSDWKSEDVGE